MKKFIGNDWDEVLAPIFDSNEYHELHEFLKTEYKTCLLYTSDAADE